MNVTSCIGVINKSQYFLSYIMLLIISHHDSVIILVKMIHYFRNTVIFRVRDVFPL